MSKRNRREHGRIISVETLTRGDALAADVAAGATSITVNDAGDFDEDGGWLLRGTQVVQFTVCDDDTGVITLAEPLTAAAEEGDPVQVWSDLYDEVVDYQLALVELDGEYDNPDPVVAEVAEGVGDLPEGDRGKAGESCTLLRVADDEWEVVGVGGRSRKSRGIKFEADDTYVLASGDITAGSVTFPLTHRPIDEALTAVLAGVPQRPTNYTINYDDQSITWPLSGWEKAGDRIWVHYAYRKGIATVTIPQDPPFEIVLTDPTGVGASGMSGGEGYLVGTGPVWKDGDDATYTEIAGSYYGDGNPQYVGSVSVQVVSSTPVITQTVVSIKARLRVAALAPGQRLPTLRLFRPTGPSLGADGGSAIAPTTPTWVELTIPGGPGDFVDFASRPGDYTYRILAPAYPDPGVPSGSQRWRVYEAQLLVELT